MTEVKELFTTLPEYDEDDNEVGIDWEAEKEYFKEFVEKEIEHYERIHRTSVSYICLAGQVGRWNGRFVGGKALNWDDNPLDCMGRVDDITVQVDEQRVIDILGHHHDGTHCMNLYLISDSLYERWDKNGYFDTPEFYAWLVENRRPVRLRRANGYYTV